MPGRAGRPAGRGPESCRSSRPARILPDRPSERLPRRGRRWSSFFAVRAGPCWTSTTGRAPGPSAAGSARRHGGSSPDPVVLGRPGVGAASSAGDYRGRFPPDLCRRHVSAPQWPPEGTPRVPSSASGRARSLPCAAAPCDRRPDPFATLGCHRRWAARRGRRGTARRGSAQTCQPESEKPGSLRSCCRATGTFTGAAVPVTDRSCPYLVRRPSRCAARSSPALATASPSARPADRLDVLGDDHGRLTAEPVVHVSDDVALLQDRRRRERVLRRPGSAAAVADRVLAA